MYTQYNPIAEAVIRAFYILPIWTNVRHLSHLPEVTYLQFMSMFGTDPQRQRGMLNLAQRGCATVTPIFGTASF